jgi:hypothetical protein
MLLRTFEDAAETLREAGARFWTLKGAGGKGSYTYEPKGEETEDAYTANAALERFSVIWDRLEGGQTYTVTHRPKFNARQNADSFTIRKNEFSNPAAVAGIGNVGGGDSDEVKRLREQLAEMRQAEAVRAAVAPLEARLNQMQQGETFTLEKGMQAIGQLSSLAGNVAALQRSGAPMPRPLAGPPAQPAVAAPVDGQDRGAEALAKLQAGLGGPEALVSALEKLAGFVEREPEQAATIIQSL